METTLHSQTSLHPSQSVFVSHNTHLGLEISVHDIVVVAVLNARNDLVEEVSGFIRGEAASGHNVVEQLATRHEFHDDKDVRGRIDHFVPGE